MNKTDLHQNKKNKIGLTDPTRKPRVEWRQTNNFLSPAQYIHKGRNFENEVGSPQYHVQNNIEALIWVIACTERITVLEFFPNDSIPNL